MMDSGSEWKRKRIGLALPGICSLGCLMCGIIHTWDHTLRESAYSHTCFSDPITVFTGQNHT